MIGKPPPPSPAQPEMRRFEVHTNVKFEVVEGTGFNVDDNGCLAIVVQAVVPNVAPNRAPGEEYLQKVTMKKLYNASTWLSLAPVPPSKVEA